MRVEAAKQAAPGQSSDFAGSLGRAVEREVERAEVAASESRALVVIEPAAAVQTAPVYREAAFLAHLIATREHAPQTRERRRAEPGEAISAYRAAMAMA